MKEILSLQSNFCVMPKVHSVLLLMKLPSVHMLLGLCHHKAQSFLDTLECSLWICFVFCSFTYFWPPISVYNITDLNDYCHLPLLYMWYLNVKKKVMVSAASCCLHIAAEGNVFFKKHTVLIYLNLVWKAYFILTTKRYGQLCRWFFSTEW